MNRVVVIVLVGWAGVVAVFATAFYHQRRDLTQHLSSASATVGRADAAVRDLHRSFEEIDKKLSEMSKLTESMRGDVEEVVRSRGGQP